MTANFMTALTDALADCVTVGQDVPERFRTDWSGLTPVIPLALVRPRTTAEVARTLALCNRFAIPVVPQGGLTGLVGGAQPLTNGILLSLDRMNAIEEIDPVMATMTVQAGALLSQVQTAAGEAGLFFGLDLGARDSCSIGGNIATNAGGTRVIRYGMVRDSILGLEVVLADGAVVSALNKMLKNNAGYDLKQLFIGAEGTLGVVTRAVLRLQARPASIASAFCGCPDFEATLRLLRKARERLAASLTAFEVMWPSFHDFMTAALPELRRPLSQPHGSYVLIETSGSNAAQNEALLRDLLTEALEEDHIADAVLPASERDARALWAIRESVSEYSRVMGPTTSFDIGLPTTRIGVFVADLEQAFHHRWPDAILLSYGHIGDSNLHLTANIPSVGNAQPHDEIAQRVYDAVAQAGGTISAEHGIGLLKKPYLALSRSREELSLMLRIKQALDPNNILNTGKLLSVDSAPSRGS